MYVCFRKVAVMLHILLREVCLLCLGQVTGYLNRDFLSFFSMQYNPYNRYNYGLLRFIVGHP
jgi:hypothetical protein